MNSLAGELAVRHLQCPLCHALPGDRCRTVYGRKPGTPTLTHEPRGKPFRDAWWEGMMEGKVYGGEQALWQAAGILDASAGYDGQVLIDWLHRLAQDRK